MRSLLTVNPIVDVHARAELLRLSAKYDVKSPKLEWSGSGEPPGYFVFDTMLLSKGWSKAFTIDPINTPRMLSYAIAHELRHWMTFAKHFPIPLPRGPKWGEKRRDYEEMTAHEFARSEVGITKSEFWSWWDRMFPGK